MKRRILLGLLAGWSLLSETAAYAEQKAGQGARDFVLADLQGAKVRLADLKGKEVILDFWATWCEPCMRELPELEKLARQDNMVVVLAVSIDKDGRDAKGTAQRLKLGSVRVLHDPKGDVAEKYDPPKMPTSYLIDAQGVVRLINAGYDGPADIERLRKQLTALRKTTPAP